LGCNSNQLTTLEVNENTALQHLGCNSNQLTTLDVSKNAELTYLGCTSNQLTNLNTKNGANAKLTKFFATANPLLKCIQVDDPTKIGATWKKDSSAEYSTYCSEPFVNIPDANFKNALLQDAFINTNGDNEIQVSEANAYFGLVDVSSKNIKTLTGIEAFINIKGLNCGTNQLTTLDISKNTTITFLNCEDNQLTTLDISKNIILINLACSSNQLSTLDVSKNTILDFLSCSSNKLSNLDMSKNTALTSLLCGSNQLTILDISKNTNLTLLSCLSNQFSTLDLSKNAKLADLICYSNQLKTLDVSKNTALTFLSCFSNQLSNLNLKNGANDKLATFNATANPLLKCIQVDDPLKIGIDWKEDATATYSAACSVSTKDATLVENLSLYPNPATNTFELSWEGENETLDMALFNSVGALIKSQKVSNQESINIENLPHGLYFCKLSDANHKMQTVKVTVE
jgi:Secretion system C-terminal sorting domain/LVIVD repeat